MKYDIPLQSTTIEHVIPDERKLFLFCLSENIYSSYLEVNKIPNPFYTYN